MNSAGVLSFEVDVVASSSADRSSSPIVVLLSEELASWALIATLAWAQFPLGSNRPWSWSLLALLIAFVWLIWLPRAVIRPGVLWRNARHAMVPFVLMLLVLAWAAIQTVSWSPPALHNGIWQIVPAASGHPVGGAISINPYETATEVMKLGCYLAAGVLAFALAQKAEIAHRFFIAISVIGAAYAAYGMFLSAVGTNQLAVFTGGASLSPGRAVSGGFVSKNSFATYDGISLVVCAVLVTEAGHRFVSVGRGARRFSLSLLQFLLGRPAYLVVAATLMFVALVLASSRAGLIAGMSGLVVLFGFAVLLAGRTSSTRWAIGAGLATLTAMIALFVLSGDSVAERFNHLVETRAGEELRPVMWAAAARAIAEHPWLGTGLGTFQDVYPLYADRFVPFVIDRAHSDYLEFALGLGIPAAVAWCGSLAWLVLLCVAGAIRRRRRRIYAVASVGAATVVALHSLVDFGLQMPAVSLLFAVVLGVGVAQAVPTSSRSGCEGDVGWAT